MELKNFNSILERMPKLDRPMRVVVAGSESENIVKGVFAAAEQGFVTPILVGDQERTRALLERLGLAGARDYMIQPPAGADVTQTAIDIVNADGGDVLMRGDIQTREFLMPILDRRNRLRTDRLMSHVSFAALPEYHKLIALSDMTVMITPDQSQKKAIVRNLVDTLHAFGYEHPKIALLALVEKSSFHMQDTVDAFEIASEHRKSPIADCELVGPISYDLILSKEAARLKHYDCPYCGDFDGIVAPNLMAGNILVKSWQIHAKSTTCGAVVGARVPIALTSRSVGADEAFMSLAFCGSLLKMKSTVPG